MPHAHPSIQPSVHPSIFTLEQGVLLSILVVTGREGERHPGEVKNSPQDTCKTHTLTRFRVLSQPDLHVFGLWEESYIEENVDSPHSKDKHEENNVNTRTLSVQISSKRPSVFSFLLSDSSLVKTGIHMSSVFLSLMGNNRKYFSAN